LPGPYNAYLDGAFAGRGELPLVARGESMTLGFGTETQLRVARELQDKHTEIKGGNKGPHAHLSGPAAELHGQAGQGARLGPPAAAPNEQVTVTLVNSGKGPQHRRSLRRAGEPRGLLRWDVDLPAGSTGRKL